MAKLNLTNLQKAIVSLRELLARANDPDLMGQLDAITRLGIKAGVVKNFEFTYELSWKALKRWLEENVGREAVDGVTRRELYRLSAESRLIADVDLWMKFHEARNLTSHTYNEAIAEQTYLVTNEFVGEAEKLLATLEARND
jgi:nucleotidyltransferase substrate binding protein (TIGR01987 family)